MASRGSVESQNCAKSPAGESPICRPAETHVVAPKSQDEPPKPVSDGPCVSDPPTGARDDASVPATEEGNTDEPNPKTGDEPGSTPEEPSECASKTNVDSAPVGGASPVEASDVQPPKPSAEEFNSRCSSPRPSRPAVDLPSELIQRILSEADLPTVLAAGAVNRAWRAVVKDDQSTWRRLLRAEYDPALSATSCRARVLDRAWLVRFLADERERYRNWRRAEDVHAEACKQDMVLACFQAQFQLAYVPGRRALYKRKTGIAYVSDKERKQGEAKKTAEFALQTEGILGVEDVVRWETERIAPHARRFAHTLLSLFDDLPHNAPASRNWALLKELVNDPFTALVLQVDPGPLPHATSRALFLCALTTAPEPTDDFGCSADSLLKKSRSPSPSAPSFSLSPALDDDSECDTDSDSDDDSQDSGLGPGSRLRVSRSSASLSRSSHSTASLAGSLTSPWATSYSDLSVVTPPSPKRTKTQSLKRDSWASWGSGSSADSGLGSVKDLPVSEFRNCVSNVPDYGLLLAALTRVLTLAPTPCLPPINPGPHLLSSSVLMPELLAENRARPRADWPQLEGIWCGLSPSQILSKDLPGYFRLEPCSESAARERLDLSRLPIPEPGALPNMFFTGQVLDQELKPRQDAQLAGVASMCPDGAVTITFLFTRANDDLTRFPDGGLVVRATRVGLESPLGFLGSFAKTSTIKRQGAAWRWKHEDFAWIYPFRGENTGTKSSCH